MNLGGNADGHIKLYQHDIWLPTAVNCTQTIYEGYQQDTSYKSLETDVKDGVKEIYKSKFLIILVEKHKFKRRQLIIPNLLKVSNKDTTPKLMTLCNVFPVNFELR